MSYILKAELDNKENAPQALEKIATQIQGGAVKGKGWELKIKYEPLYKKLLSKEE